MKTTLLIFICIVTQSLIAQQKKCTAYLVEEETKTPIFGAVILLNEKTICTSDQFGKIEFKINTSKNDNYVKIRHQSYEIDSILIKNLSQKPLTIELIEKFTKLDEVIIIGNLKLTKKEIIKNAVEKFKNSNRKKPYWSSINFKSIISYNEIPLTYYEMNGHAFMIGENRDPFIYPILIPKKIRKVKANKEISNLKSSNILSKNRINYFSDGGNSLFNFRCFESVHPLSKKRNKSFEFKIENIENIDNQKHYVIRYKQIKKIHQKRDLYTIEGQLWVNKKDFTLKKSTVGFGFDKMYYSNITINYKKLNNIIYPSKIQESTYNYKESNLTNKMSSTFNEIDTKVRENYALRYPPYLQRYITATIYDNNYWKNHPLNDKSYHKSVLQIISNKDWDVAFLKGAKEPQYEEKSRIAKGIKLYEKQNLELLNKMKKDLEIKD